MAGDDIDGLDAHEFVPGPVAARVGGQAVRVPQPGALQLVADAAGVGEPRPPHLPGDVVAERRLGVLGEVIAGLLQHQPRDVRQLAHLVGREVEVVRDPGTHPRV